MTTRRRHALTVLAALGGLVLFGYAVRRAGVAEILDGIRQVGWGLLPILGLAGARFLIRACAWRLCMPPHGRLSIGQAFSAFVAGDAIGNLTPLGMVASEPTKVFLTRHRLATRESVASLATDNLLYAASDRRDGRRSASSSRSSRCAAVAGVARRRDRGARRRRRSARAITLRLLRGTWREESGARPAWRETLADLRRSVLAFSTEQPGRLVQVFLLDLSFHALAVLEIFLTLRWLLGDRSPTIGAGDCVRGAQSRRDGGLQVRAVQGGHRRSAVRRARAGDGRPAGGGRDARRRAKGEESDLDRCGAGVYRRPSCSR